MNYYFNSYTEYKPNAVKGLWVVTLGLLILLFVKLGDAVKLLIEEVKSLH